MIIHNRDIYNSEEYSGSGLIDTVLSLVNGVIQHKDAIKDVVTVAKDVVNIGKDVKSMVGDSGDSGASNRASNRAKEKKDSSVKEPLSTIVQPQESEVPEDIKSIVKHIKYLSMGNTASQGKGIPTGEFRYV